jgi:hypothetical protein
MCINAHFVLTRTKMSKDTVTAVRQDGLRYQSKVGGSPFLGSGHTRSCFKCGKHRAPSSLQSIRLLGRNEVVCKPNCKTLP